MISTRHYTSRLICIFLLSCFPVSVFAKDGHYVHVNEIKPATKKHELDLDRQLASFIKNYPPASEIQTPMLQYRVGLLYLNGQGLEKNLHKAINWLEKSAQKNHAPAQYELGLLYTKGRGVKQNIPKARQWFNKAVDNGSAVASKALDALDSTGAVQSTN